MSSLTKQQFDDTFEKLVKAVENVCDKPDPADKRAALQDVVALCDAFKASCVGYSGAIGYAKREGRF